MIAYINQAIDTLSNAQKSFVETFIKDSKVAGSVNTIIDSTQTFSKSSAKSILDYLDSISTVISKGGK